MNPIFSRRYKGGSRPNIMPTSAKRQNYMTSIGNTDVVKSVNASDSVTMSMGSDSMTSTISMSCDREDQLLESKSQQQQGRASRGHGAMSNSSSSLLAHQLFSSKQNMLAQMNLTPHENQLRTSDSERKPKKSSLMKQSFSTENLNKASGQNNGILQAMPRSPTVHVSGDMTLEDFDFDVDDSQRDLAPNFASPVTVANTRKQKNCAVSKKALDMKQWRELKKVVTGTGSFSDGWVGQGFVFDSKIPFGIVQKKGGPCGVLAVVQSLVIRNLLFGSPFTDANHIQNESNLKNFAAHLTAGDWIDDAEMIADIKRARLDCLVQALREILWRCAENEQGQKRQCMIMFSDYGIQPEVICVEGQWELQQLLQNSIHRFDCISLVNSAALTRGLSRIKDDMDFENCSLIGQFGYCSQELINLLAIGRAISNTFDNDIELEGKVLKGIPARCDVGLLSLFEHYDSIKVGQFLKEPKFPVWMICSESHFSVLFSPETSLCEGDIDGNLDNSTFDLFYYDGLARQEKIVRLSINIPENSHAAKRTGNVVSDSSNRFSSYVSVSHDSHYKSTGTAEDLIPPLEKCIRTKWKGALVDWNDTEPIL